MSAIVESLKTTNVDVNVDVDKSDLVNRENVQNALYLKTAAQQKAGEYFSSNSSSAKLYEVLTSEGGIKEYVANYLSDLQTVYGKNTIFVILLMLLIGVLFLISLFISVLYLIGGVIAVAFSIKMNPEKRGILRHSSMMNAFVWNWFYVSYGILMM